MKKRIYVCLLALFTVGCSNVKYLPKGESLYVKGEVKLESDSIPKQYRAPLIENLQGMLRPRPNKKFLGMRLKLAIYNRAGHPKSEKGIKGWLKYKVGEPPVLLSEVNRSYNETLLRNRLENIGFFDAEVSSDTVVKNRKATITFSTKPNRIHRMTEVSFNTDSSELGKAIKATESSSLLVVGKPFNLDRIISERERIDNVLKNKGFYYFSPEYLEVVSDSTIGNHAVSAEVAVKTTTPALALKPYIINNIYIYPNYTLSQGSYQTNDHKEEFNEYRGYFFSDPDRTFRKSVLARSMFLRKGDLYNRERQTLAINHLTGLGAFKFVKNNFVLTDSGKTNKLDVYYYLTPAPKKAIRVEVLGKTASVYNGSELNVSWRNRSIFNGAEMLRISLYGGFETQTGGNVNLNSSYHRYGTEVSLSFPRLITPFSWSPSRRYVPHTTITTGYEYLNRVNSYSLNSMRFAFGYNWKENEQKEHTLNPLEIGYVQPRNVTESYLAQVDTIPTLQHAIDKQFTFGPTYNFTYTNTMEEGRTNTQYFKGGIDLSGNIYGLIKGANYNKGKVYQLFNADFSQYIKIEGDLRNYTKLGTNSEVAVRAMIGYGYSYGNSVMLPYVKQYFAGGPNSLRSFRARAIGPGSYEPPKYGVDNFVPDQTGDIKIELNAEYRAGLYGFVKWAAFIDAGNIWLQHADPDKPGANFSKNFLKELAVGAGLGLRFDFSYLVLRTDFAFPLRIPYLPENERWVINKIDFGSSGWRSDNLIFNLAIGYPF
ncbi:Outer membrane protein assembly factor BamA [bacterium A37T11]|nr:Outer membrane protein assembly factor BamA [bacterium A37T11]